MTPSQHAAYIRQLEFKLQKACFGLGMPYTVNQHTSTWLEDRALIEAAPDLLAALQQISTALEHHQHWKPTMVDHLTGIARAAIAKAEGGQS